MIFMEDLEKKASFEKDSHQLPKKRMWKFMSEELASIGVLNPEDTFDVERYKQMDRSPDTQKWMIGEEMTEQEIKEFFASHFKDVLLYAISGKESYGELEGWVQLLPEEKERIDRVRKLALADFPEDNLILELSYARYKDPNLPEERREKGLIPSGLRQICYSLGLTLTEQNREVRESKKPLLKPKLSIAAYTDPANKASERVLEKAGFKNVGTIQYKPGDKKYDNFWILDWGELSNIYAKKDEERARRSILKKT